MSGGRDIGFYHVFARSQTPFWVWFRAALGNKNETAFANKVDDILMMMIDPTPYKVNDHSQNFFTKFGSGGLYMTTLAWICRLQNFYLSKTGGGVIFTRNQIFPNSFFDAPWGYVKRGIRNTPSAD
jgi:hypothetical protein